MNRIIPIQNIKMVFCPRLNGMQPVKEYPTWAIGCSRCHHRVRIEEENDSVVCNFRQEGK